MKLLILDGNSILNRAFYGVHALTTRDGLYTNGIFGFLNILHKLMDEEKPDALCVAFDLKGPTFRHEKYELYKANRHGMPDELAQQMPYLRDVLSAMKIPMYALQGWEADDVIGTVTKICCRDGWQCVVATGDRDSLQLVNDCVTVRLAVSRAGQTTYTAYTPQLFREEYGFEPARLVDLKALMGDSSDNIPGVTGIGPKTAKELLLQYGSLDAVYAQLGTGALKTGVEKKLAECRDMAYLSYDLATIRCDAPMEFTPADAVLCDADKPRLRELFLRLEFSKLMSRYGLNAETALKEVSCRALPQLPDPGQPCAVVVSDGIVGIATAGGVITASLLEEREYLQRFFASAAPRFCADLKSLYHSLWSFSMDMSGEVFDVSLAAYVLDSSQGDYSVPRLAISYLGKQTVRDAAAEAEAVWLLQAVLQKKLEEASLAEYYTSTELPLCRVLAKMEQAGVGVDRNALSSFGKMLTERIAACQSIVFEFAGEEFNINSTKKLGEVLFDKLGLPPMKKTKTGYSTGAEVLEKLRHQHPIIPAILDYRMLTKLNSTYAEGLMKVIGEDGRIHTTFQNMVTATGRLSSTEPNLQNIPVRTDMGSEIRRMFVPTPGWKLVDADYSQIELRVLAHIADDEAMREAFCSGEDFHSATAAQAFGVALCQVTPKMRRNAKAVNFGVVYGISEFSLAEDLGISRAEAKAFIDAYLARFTGVADYRRRVVEDAYKNGYVSTITGRKRYLPELSQKNHMLRLAGERMALNSPIQGSAADIMKIATVHVAEAFEKSGLKARLLLQVHDELIAECPPEEVEAVQTILKREMEQAVSLSVPLTTEAKHGNSWYEIK